MADKPKYTPDSSMADFLGSHAKVTWGDALRKVHAYIKKNGLRKGQDIHPNAHLAIILGKSKLTQMQIAAHVKKHLNPCA